MKEVPARVPVCLPGGLAAVPGTLAGRGAGTQSGTCFLERPLPTGLPLVASSSTLRFPTPLTQRLKKHKCEWGLETQSVNPKGGAQWGGGEKSENGDEREKVGGFEKVKMKVSGGRKRKEEKKEETEEGQGAALEGQWVES